VGRNRVCPQFSVPEGSAPAARTESSTTLDDRLGHRHQPLARLAIPPEAARGGTRRTAGSGNATERSRVRHYLARRGGVGEDRLPGSGLTDVTRRRLRPPAAAASRATLHSSASPRTL